MNKSLLFCLSLCFFSCKKDVQSPCEQLVDSWRCTSWIENQQEALSPGGKVSSLIARMEPVIEDGRGPFNWTAVYSSGQTQVFDGKYTVDSACTKIQFTPTGQTSFQLSFRFDGDNLLMDGELNGSAVALAWERY